MALTKMTGNVMNISALPDKVTNQASTLKGLFDQAGSDIKAFVNSHIDELSASTASGNIGALDGETATTIQAILSAFKVAIADRYTKAETNTKVSTETNTLVADVDVNLTTGVITVTKKDGTIETFDTSLEKVPATFEIVEVDGVYYLKITNVDGSISQTDITNLMNIYTFNNTDEIAFSTSGEGNEKTVTATIRANSIGLDKLSLSVVSTIEGYANSASASASSASTSATNAATSELNASESASTATTKASEASASASNANASASTATTKANEATSSATIASNKAILSESWAIGGTSTRTGENTNNAKFWSEQAEYVAGSLSTDTTVVTTDWIADSTYTDYAYKATKSVSGVTATNNIVVGIAENATVAQEEAGIEAGVKCKGQGTGVIYLYAKTVPTVDLPITILLCGGSKSEDIPTKTSDLTNDSGFIDNTVTNLTNYTNNTTLPTTVRGVRPVVVTTNPATLAVNTVYTLGVQTNLTLNLPVGVITDWIEVKFLSGTTPTTLTINATSSSLSAYDLIPEANKTYNLFLEWSELDNGTYGWCVSYGEYVRGVA